jgi:hypothetical protein
MNCVPLGILVGLYFDDMALKLNIRLLFFVRTTHFI